MRQVSKINSPTPYSEEERNLRKVTNTYKYVRCHYCYIMCPIDEVTSWIIVDLVGDRAKFNGMYLTKMCLKCINERKIKEEVTDEYA